MYNAYNAYNTYNTYNAYKHCYLVGMGLVLEAQIPENVVDQMKEALVDQWNLLDYSSLGRVPVTKEAGSQKTFTHSLNQTLTRRFEIPSESLGKWNSPRHAQDRTNTLYIVGSLFCAASFIRATACIIGRRFRPARQGIIFQDTAGGFKFGALCDLLDNIALPRLWGSDVPTVPASSKHVTPWTVIAESNPPRGLNALIPATASPCHLLVVLASQHHLFGNMIF